MIGTTTSVAVHSAVQGGYGAYSGLSSGTASDYGNNPCPYCGHQTADNTWNYLSILPAKGYRVKFGIIFVIVTAFVYWLVK